MGDLVKAAWDGLAFLAKMNTNHGSDGRFTGGSASVSPGERFTSNAETPEGEMSKGVHHDGRFYSDSDAKIHDNNLEKANAGFEQLYGALGATALELRDDSPNMGALKMHAREIEKQAGRINDSLDRANAVRSKYGDDEVGLHRRDIETLEDGAGLASTVHEHINGLRDLRKSFREYLPS